MGLPKRADISGREHSSESSYQVIGSTMMRWQRGGQWPGKMRQPHAGSMVAGVCSIGWERVVGGDGSEKEPKYTHTSEKAGAAQTGNDQAKQSG